jgi:hypothetical protein
MARKVVEELIDDLDGSTAEESIPFSLDGSSYTIDLSGKNAAEFRELMAPFVAAAVKVGRRSPHPGVVRSSSARPAGNRERLAAVRAWAKANGHEVNDRGRIPNSVIEAYDQAQRNPLPEPETPAPAKRNRRAKPKARPEFSEAG